MVTVAGIDCGTNSIRLMIARVDENGMHIVLPRIMRVVRLGEGVDVNHAFSQAALERVYAAIDEFADLLARYQVDALRFVATSATRDARNREDFENYVHEHLGVWPDVISGEEEARLSFLGATSVAGIDQYEAPFLVVDLGGGSTELVLGGTQAEKLHVQATYSMAVGSVRMSERHRLDDAPSIEAIEAATKDIDEHIEQAASVVPLDAVRTIIGVSGTVTTMSAVCLGQKEYRVEEVDGAVLSIDAVDEVNQRVLRMTRQQRDTLSVVHPGRRDVIGAGALVWSCVLAAVQTAAATRDIRIDSYIASEHGLLDGIVRDLGQRMQHADRAVHEQS